MFCQVRHAQVLYVFCTRYRSAEWHSTDLNSSDLALEQRTLLQKAAIADETVFCTPSIAYSFDKHRRYSRETTKYPYRMI